MSKKANENLGLHPGKQIDWKACNRKLFELQAQLYNALKLKQSVEKIHKIHNAILTTFATRALAVRKVTSNKGKNTAGIDKQLGTKDEHKGQGIEWLKNQNGNCYKCEPIKRVYIPKQNSSEKRPLGIPTIKDRAAQALGNYILDVHQEYIADYRSFGFRIGRSARQAIGFIHREAAGPQQKRSIMSIDIKKAYDSVKHKGIINNIPINKKVLNTWLTADINDKGTIIRPTMGVPQGGPISPTIFNYVLNGIDTEVKKIKYCTPVRFADDILVLARTNEQLLNALENIKKFIAPRGLSINDQKTVITTIETGFDYLGYNIREYKDDSRTDRKGFGLKRGIVICKPSKKSMAKIKLDIRELIIKHAHSSAGMLIMKLNPLISGGANYFNSKGGGTKAKNTIGKYIGDLLDKGVRKKHRKFKGGMRKLMKKYFKGVQRSQTYRNNWTFFGKVDGKDLLITDIQQIKVRSENVLPFSEDMNPYNPDVYDKFMTRNRSAIVKDITNNKQKRSLLQKQNAICPLCEGWIDGTENTQIDHIKPKAKGGTDKLSNLQVVHTTCHQQKTAIERRSRSIKRRNEQKAKMIQK